MSVGWPARPGLVEHRPPALDCGAAVAGNGDLQHQGLASNRQIGQRADHRVAILAVAAAVRTARITSHRRAEDRRLLLVDGGVGDRHPNSMVRMIVSATTDGGQAVTSDTRDPSVVWWASAGTPHPHPPRPRLSSPTPRPARRSAHHPCTLVHEEPVNLTVPQYGIQRDCHCGSRTGRRVELQELVES